MKARWFIVLATLGNGAAFAQQEEVTVLPESLAPDHFQALMDNSPFSRVLDFEKTFALRGIARVGEETVAWLYNRDTKKTITVKESSANEMGMKLLSVDEESSQLNRVSVQIQIGDEGIELAYDSDRVAPKTQMGKKYEYDKYGRAIPPKRLIDKFRRLSREQMGKYQVWRARMVKKNPKMDKSPERFPVIEKAMDALLRGESPKPY